MWFDKDSDTDFGETAEHLNSEIFIRKSMNLTKIENALRGHTRRWADQKSCSEVLRDRARYLCQTTCTVSDFQVF